MPETRLAHLHPLRWLGQRDRGLAALRRATRAAIIMPAMFAVGDKVIGNPQLATFAAFGSFAMLLLADFGGPMAERLQAEAALAVTGGVFVCLATLASRTAWLAAVAMAVAGFGVIFAGVVSHPTRLPGTARVTTEPTTATAPITKAIDSVSAKPARPGPVIGRSDGRTSKGDHHGGAGRGRGKAAAARRCLRAIHKPMVHEVCLSCHSRRAGPVPGVIPR